MPAPSTTIPLLDLPEVVRELGVLEVSGNRAKSALPLRAVDIVAVVADRIATVKLTQIFKNDLFDHMEAVYIFPLAAGCAVSSFNLRVGDRVVEGIVKERSEARQEYQQALNNGHRAALMEQERDDVFTVQVGNIPAGQEVTVELTYSEKMPFYENGKTELRLPMVVAPRYTPGNELPRVQTGFGVQPDTNLVPDASRISPPRLVEGNPGNVALSVTVEILPDESISELSDLECSQHATRLGLRPGVVQVSLAKTNERLNRDFVLRWKVCSESIRSSLLTYKNKDGETFGVLSIVPPAKGYRGAPRDIIFIVDKSGSMEGIKMVSAVRACSILLNTLGPADRFAIVSFDYGFQWMSEAGVLLEANESGIQAGENFLRSIHAQGGTELENVLSSAIGALRGRPGKAGRTSAIVVITDGEVSNESQILKRIQRDLGDTRLFAVGVDTAVNAGVLKRMANLGGGTAAFVEPGIQLEEALASIGREIGHPLVTDLQVDDQDLSVVDRASISPSRIPDMFAGRASLAFFKMTGHKVKVRGTLSNGELFEVVTTAREVQIPAIAQLWAKAHIVDLEDRFRVATSQREQLKSRIIQLAVQHSLLTKFTAFVAVDKAEVVNQSGLNRTIVQPVEMPASWDMRLDATTAPSAPCSIPMPAARPVPPSESVRRRAQSSLTGYLQIPDCEESEATSTRLKSLSRAMPPAAPTPPGQPAAPAARADNANLKREETSFNKLSSDAWSVAERQSLPGGGGGAPRDSDGWGSAPSNEPHSGWGAPYDAEANDGWTDASTFAEVGEVAGTVTPSQSGAAAIGQPTSGSGTAPDTTGDTGKTQADSIRDSIADKGASQKKAKTSPDQYGLDQLSAKLDQAENAHAKDNAAKAQAESAQSSHRETRQMAQDERVAKVAQSYGSGVRAQVFEVIVRQAMAGAPWREIAAGPMAVNHIDPEEVEAEVNRRRGGTGSAPQKPAQKGILGKLDDLKNAIFGSGKKELKDKNILTQFFEEFIQAFNAVASGTRPNAVQLEHRRQQVLRVLADHQVEAPKLQKFLRSDAIELIASLQDQSSELSELQEFWASRKTAIAAAIDETQANHLSSGNEQFWDSTV